MKKWTAWEMNRVSEVTVNGVTWKWEVVERTNREIKARFVKDGTQLTSGELARLLNKKKARIDRIEYFF